jgi:hypothetical protein
MFEQSPFRLWFQDRTPAVELKALPVLIIILYIRRLERIPSSSKSQEDFHNVSHGARVIMKIMDVCQTFFVTVTQTKEKKFLSLSLESEAWKSQRRKSSRDEKLVICFSNDISNESWCEKHGTLTPWLRRWLSRLMTVVVLHFPVTWLFVTDPTRDSCCLECSKPPTTPTEPCTEVVRQWLEFLQFRNKHLLVTLDNSQLEKRLLHEVLSLWQQCHLSLSLSSDVSSNYGVRRSPWSWRFRQKTWQTL